MTGSRDDVPCMNCVSCGASHDDVTAKERERIIQVLRGFSKDRDAPESFREAWRLMANILDPAPPQCALMSVKQYVAWRAAEAERATNEPHKT